MRFRSSRNSGNGNFRYPDSMLLYHRNPLQQLGLLPHQITMRALMNRKASLVALLRATVSPTRVPGYLPIPWPTATEVTVPSIQAACTQLADATQRFHAEFFWFDLPEESADHAAALFSGDFKRASKLLESALSASPDEAPRLLCNRAILRHALTIDAEGASLRRRFLPPRSKLPRRQLKRWERAIALWREIHDSPALKAVIYEISERIDDPRLDRDFLERSRTRIPKTILKVNLDIARSAYKQKRFAYAVQHVRLVRRSSFEAKLVSRMLEAFYFDLFGAEIQALQRRIAALLREQPDGDHFEACVQAINEAKGLLSEARRTDLQNELDAVLDDLYRVVKQPVVDKAYEEIATVKEAAYEFLLARHNAANRAIDKWNALPRVLSGYQVTQAESAISELHKLDNQSDTASKHVSDLTAAVLRGVKLLEQLQAIAVSKKTRSLLDQTIGRYKQLGEESEDNLASEVTKQNSWISGNHSGMRQTLYGG